ncbi:MAG: hypothetical protein R6W67_09565 [Bacteroidales bacterium]
MKKFVLISIILTLANAHSFSCPETTDCVIIKSFKAGEKTELNIENRYGTISIVNSPVDSVIICGTMLIDHTNPQTAEKSLSLINMEINSTGNNINVKTSFDDRFFTSSFSSGRKSFNVNYIIKVPSFINLNIENSFGDVILEDISGFVNISLNHGNLSAGRLLRDNVKPLNSIILNHSRAKISDAGWLIIESYHSPSVEISNCQALSVISEFSGINIGSVNSLVFSSKSDVYTIDKVTNCVSEVWLTRVKISEISDILRTTANISTFRIDKLLNDFTEINLIGHNSAFTFVCDGSNSFMLSAKAESAVIDLPEAYRGNITRQSESPVSFKLSGLFGNDQNTKSKVNAVISQGKLEFLTLSGKR